MYLYGILRAYTHFSHRLMGNGIILKFKGIDEYVIDKVLLEDRTIVNDFIQIRRDTITAGAYSVTPIIRDDAIEYIKKHGRVMISYELGNDILLEFRLFFAKSDEDILLEKEVQGIERMWRQYD